MRHVTIAPAVLLALVMLAGCAGREGWSESEPESAGPVAPSAYAEAIAEGMARARVDLMRRAVRRMLMRGGEGPPG
ncbi:hypothetical protein J8J14_02800 [Roseomonas sp. SSH11]|uniref:Lipoprotein n=1 Tax=Pararoseomonas baculiformis TaxID=2820812 RepID=A0ABS4AA14_9PROT|nr:hypothetical protein [Pararoseomonas baculiformis]MBP0443696.1 hypothetical protein [Pararoseomonas baculiformis]